MVLTCFQHMYLAWNVTAASQNGTLLLSRHPPDANFVKTELAAFDGFWQCRTLDTGGSRAPKRVTSARRAPKISILLEATRSRQRLAGDAVDMIWRCSMASSGSGSILTPRCSCRYIVTNICALRIVLPFTSIPQPCRSGLDSTPRVQLLARRQSDPAETGARGTCDVRAPAGVSERRGVACRGVRPPHAPPDGDRRTNRLFLTNMSMSSPAFTSDKHATIGDTIAPVSALSDRLPDGGDGRNALPSR
jgi:hypothetical protein